MPRFRGIRMITGAVSKAVRRQKEKRLASVSKTFFKDGSTKFGRQRIDRALGSIYGHVIPQKNIGLTKVGKKYIKEWQKQLKDQNKELKKDMYNADTFWRMAT